MSRTLPAGGAVAVDIPDRHLRDAIERALGKEPGEAITRSEMETLTRLDASNSPVVDLTGLEVAVRLTRLGLHSGRIADLSPLAELKWLKSLSLGNNDISDLAPLAGLTELTFLDLDRNEIENLGPLSGLEKLDRLLLRDNAVVDLTPLTGLASLTRLLLDHNAIADVAPLSGLRGLTVLTLSYNRISSLAPLAGAERLTDLEASSNLLTDARWAASMPELTSVNLSYNGIANLAPLAGLKRLTSLQMAYNGLSDLGPLAELTEMRRLWLWGNRISDVSPLGGLTALDDLVLASNPLSGIAPLGRLGDLRRLNLAATGTSDISALASLGALEAVSLGENTIADLSPLAHLKELTTLRLNRADISDLSAIAGLVRLTYAELGGNRISDLSPLAGLTDLERLFLTANRISDLSPLSGLPALEQLYLDRNSVRDLRPLVDNPGLGDGDRVSLFGNPLGGVSVRTHIPALRGRGVAVYFAPAAPVSVRLALRVDAPPGGTKVFGRNDVIRLSAYALQGSFRCEGTFVARIQIGDQLRYASSGHGHHGPTVQLTYLVTDDDRDTDGITIEGDALEFVEGICSDVAGSGILVQLFEGTLANHGDYRVNGSLDRPPAIESLDVGRPAAGDVFATGEPLVLRVRFDEPIRVLGAPRIRLDVGGDTRFAELKQRSRTALTFVYRVAPGDLDADGVAFPGLLQIDGGSIRDAGGNRANLRVPAADQVLPYGVRGDAPGGAGPTVSGVSVDLYRTGSAVAAARGMRQNDDLRIRVDFTGHLEMDDAPTLAMRMGHRIRHASLAGISRNSLRFEYLVKADDRDAEGIAIDRDALAFASGAGLRDGAGKPGRLDLGVHAVGKGGGPRVHASRIDEAPVVESARFAELTGRRGNAGLGAGEPILLLVRFNEPVRVVTADGVPSADVRLGSEQRRFDWIGGTDIPQYRRWLLFGYVVDSADDVLAAGTGGAGPAPVTIQLNGGRILDRAGNAARVTMPADFVAPFWRIDGAVQPPRVARVEDNYLPYTAISSDRGEDRSFGRHEIVDIPVYFTERIAVTGMPILPFRVGSEAREASYVSGSGTRRLLFRYRVREGDLGRLQVPATSIRLEDGLIIGGSGKDAELSLGGIPQPAAFGRLFFVNVARPSDTVVPPVAAPRNVRVDPGAG